MAISFTFGQDQEDDPTRSWTSQLEQHLKPNDQVGAFHVPSIRSFFAGST